MSAPPCSAQVRHRDRRAVDLAPVVDVELPPHVLDREIHDAAVDRDGGVVDPGVDAAELARCAVSAMRFDLLRVGDIGDDVDGAPALPADLLDGASRGRARCARRAPRRRPRSRRHLRRHQPDAAGRAGDDDDLFRRGA